MSDLSDEVEATLRELAEAAKDTSMMEIVVGDGNAQVNTNPVAQEHTAPGVQSFNHRSHHRTINALRRVYRRHAGAETPPTGEAFVEATKEEMLTELAVPAFAALSDGVLVGQGELFQVKKARDTDDYGHVFNSRSFTKESETYALTLSSDADLLRLIHENIWQSVEGMSKGTGYAEITTEQNKSMVNKVWDIWGVAGGAVSSAMYHVGFNLGRKWHERDVLAGITAATQSQGGSDAD